MTAWPTLPILKPIDAKCRNMPYLPDWDDLKCLDYDDDAYQAEKELADSFMRCHACGSTFPNEELRGNRPDGFHCSDCYKPDAWDNAEHRYRQNIDNQLERN